MNKELEGQYDGFAERFTQGTDVFNVSSRNAYYALFDFDLQGKKVLDVGCGDGYDLEYLTEKGAIGYGIDASNQLVNLARQRLPNSVISHGLMEHLPFPGAFFDAVISKYALQTSVDVPGVLREMDRVLKVGGKLLYLTVHPLRQFVEKKKHPKDYFLQEIVESTFFGGSITAKEPTHTMNEYLNPDFLRKYRITQFSEQGDFPSSENVDGDVYPCFFVLGAEKILE